MDELEFDPDEFVFTEMWILAEVGYESTAIAGGHYLGGPLEDGSRGAFLFSDRDLAGRFIVQVSLAGQVVPVQFPGLAEFAGFLRAIQSEGITRLVVDPSGSMDRSERSITLAQALASIDKTLREPQ